MKSCSAKPGIQAMGLFNQSGGMTIAILVGIALVTGWLLLRSHRYLSRRKADDAVLVRTLRPQPKNSRHHLDADPSVLRWEVEMHEIARALSARPDRQMG